MHLGWKMGTGYFFDFKKVPVPLFPKQEIVLAQKEGYRQILDNTKEIHSTLTTLNQQNREYYSLRFSEVQKELSGMKAKLGLLC